MYPRIGTAFVALTAAAATATGIWSARGTSDKLDKILEAASSPPSLETSVALATATSDVEHVRTGLAALAGEPNIAACGRRRDIEESLVTIMDAVVKDAVSQRGRRAAHYKTETKEAKEVRTTLESLTYGIVASIVVGVAMATTLVGKKS